MKRNLTTAQIQKIITKKFCEEVYLTHVDRHRFTPGMMIFFLGVEKVGRVINGSHHIASDDSLSWWVDVELPEVGVIKVHAANCERWKIQRRRVAPAVHKAPLHQPPGAA